MVIKMKLKAKEALLNALIAGIFSFIISALLNYYVIPFPESKIANVIGHGAGGFFSGFFSAIIGITVYVWHNRQNSN